MAEYTTSLGLYKPNRIDAVAVDTSLSDNFVKIDNKFVTVDSEVDQVASDLADLTIEVNKKPDASTIDNQEEAFTIAHRGFSSKAPENTMSAYRLAKEAGFKAVETDIHFTSDGIPVLMHDTTVDRTTNGTGTVASKTLTQIRALDAGSWFGSEFTGELVPTLEELIVYCRDEGITGILELKGTYTQAQIDAIIALVESYSMEGSSKIISFSFTNLGMVRNTNTTIPVGYLTESFTNANMDSIKNLGNSFINLKYTSVTVTGMAYAKSIGLPVAVYTVNNVDDLQKFFRLGALAITTDQIPNLGWGAGVPIIVACTLVVDANSNIYYDTRFLNSGFTSMTITSTHIQLNTANIPTAKRPVGIASIDFYGQGSKYQALAGYATNTYVRIQIADLAGVVKNPTTITDKLFINVALIA